METKDIITLTISSIALIFSILSIWINTLKPFKLVVFSDSPTFSLYKITPEISGINHNQIWWIPSFDLGISFNNIGKLSGIIHDLRLVCIQREFQTKRELIFYPQWIVDYPKFQKAMTERMTWIEESVIREWYSTVIPGNSNKDLHIILEGDRWDNKFNGEFEVSLEIFTSKENKWIKVSNFEWGVYEDMFDSIDCYSLLDKSQNARRT